MSNNYIILDVNECLNEHKSNLIQEGKYNDVKNIPKKVAEDAEKIINAVDEIAKNNNYSFVDNNVAHYIINSVELSNNPLGISDNLYKLNNINKESKELGYNPTGAFISLIYSMIEEKEKEANKKINEFINKDSYNAKEIKEAMESVRYLKMNEKEKVNDAMEKIKYEIKTTVLPEKIEKIIVEDPIANYSLEQVLRHSKK